MRGELGIGRPPARRQVGVLSSQFSILNYRRGAAVDTGILSSQFSILNYRRGAAVRLIEAGLPAVGSVSLQVLWGRVCRAGARRSQGFHPGCCWIFSGAGRSWDRRAPARHPAGSSQTASSVDTIELQILNSQSLMQNSANEGAGINPAPANHRRGGVYPLPSELAHPRNMHFTGFCKRLLNS